MLVWKYKVLTKKDPIGSMLVWKYKVLTKKDPTPRPCWYESYKVHPILRPGLVCKFFDVLNTRTMLISWEVDEMNTGNTVCMQKWLKSLDLCSWTSAWTFPNGKGKRLGFSFLHSTFCLGSCCPLQCVHGEDIKSAKYKSTACFLSSLFACLPSKM